jgi:putative DNA primase/helicase
MFKRFKSEFPTVTGANERAMKRFVLVALAGELATKANLTGWECGKSENDCMAMFKVWFASRPKGDSEAHKARQQLMDYIDRNACKFEALNSNNFSVTIADRAGYYETVDGCRMYLFFSSSFDSALKGLNISNARRTLSDNGILNKANDGKYQKQKHIPALNASRRLYHIDSNALFSEPKDDL